MYGLTRATTTLLAVGIAGGLIWLAGWIGLDDSNGEYWAAVALIAGAGLVLALSQVVGGWTKWGRPTISWAVLGLAFVPTLIAAGWILVAGQPVENGAREATRDWLAEIGLFDNFLEVLIALTPAIALGMGLVFGLVFDTTGRRVREDVVHDERRTADEPVAAERDHETTRPLPRRHEAPDGETTVVGAGAVGDRRERSTEDDERPRRRLFGR